MSFTQVLNDEFIKRNIIPEIKTYEQLEELFYKKCSQERVARKVVNNYEKKQESFHIIEEYQLVNINYDMLYTKMEEYLYSFLPNNYFVSQSDYVTINGYKVFVIEIIPDKRISNKVESIKDDTYVRSTNSAQRLKTYVFAILGIIVISILIDI